MNLLVRENIGRRAECRQRRFVKARQDQLLLARIGIDIAHREDAGHVGFKLLGIDANLFALDFEAPLGNWPELRRKAEEHQQVIEFERPCHAVATCHLDTMECFVIVFEAAYLAHETLHAQVIA
jgi:hypothetical protein